MAENSAHIGVPNPVMLLFKHPGCTLATEQELQSKLIAKLIMCYDFLHISPRFVTLKEKPPSLQNSNTGTIHFQARVSVLY